ncbi:hypothetical protein AVEN_125428-1 [Araneus ventricosus]|uniref:Uncharacterized protein n=1 Tax=Araneus ventricosus TaxID=182803 RepID=A0A4Y2GS45_ARAVE|nr:hypothetical protein AVEN_125428-1 [Araneus ventricosus]
MATSASWSDRMDAEDTNDAEDIPLNVNMLTDTVWLSSIGMKKNEGKRCAQIREFEDEIEKCSSIIDNSSALIKALPENTPMEYYHQIVRECSIIWTALQQKVSEIGICPVANCLYHSNSQTNLKISTKRNRTPSTKSIKTKLTKIQDNQKPVDESEFKIPPKRHTAKLITDLNTKNNNDNPSVKLSNKFDNLPVDEAEKGPTTIVQKPPHDAKKK